MVSPVDAATDLCSKRGEEIGITEDTLDKCIQSATEYIRSVISEWLSSRAVKVTRPYDSILTLICSTYRFQ